MDKPEVVTHESACCYCLNQLVLDPVWNSAPSIPHPASCASYYCANNRHMMSRPTARGRSWVTHSGYCVCQYESVALLSAFRTITSPWEPASAAQELATSRQRTERQQKRYDREHTRDVVGAIISEQSLVHRIQHEHSAG